MVSTIFTSYASLPGGKSSSLSHQSASWSCSNARLLTLCLFRPIWALHSTWACRSSIQKLRYTCIYIYIKIHLNYKCLYVLYIIITSTITYSSYICNVCVYMCINIDRGKRGKAGSGEHGAGQGMCGRGEGPGEGGRGLCGGR